MLSSIYSPAGHSCVFYGVMGGQIGGEGYEFNSGPVPRNRTILFDETYASWDNCGDGQPKSARILRLLQFKLQ